MAIWRDIPGYIGIYQVSDTGVIVNQKNGKHIKPTIVKEDIEEIKNLYKNKNITQDNIGNTLLSN